MRFEDLGIIDYKKAWDYQIELFDKIIDKKKNSQTIENHVLICEHPHVITLGRNAKQNNLLYSENFLRTKNVSLYNIDRGGDITYHGYGQLVVYPILDLEFFNIGLKEYIFRMEEVVIQVLNNFGIRGQRLEGAPGVWISKNKELKKICAIGVKCSRYVTMHGLALNVNTDLSYFSFINPCGFVDKGVTSIEAELDEKIDLEKVKELFNNLFVKIVIN